MFRFRQAQEWQVRGSYLLHPTRDVSHGVEPSKDELAAQELLTWKEGTFKASVIPFLMVSLICVFNSCPLQVCVQLRSFDAASGRTDTLLCYPSRWEFSTSDQEQLPFCFH